MYSGNKSDDQTHQVNWQSLRELLNGEDFIYIADSKLCSTANMEYISGAGGQFISILPATRKEVQDFHKELEQIVSLESADLPSNWQEAHRRENSRKKTETIIYRIKEVSKTKEGFRLIWVHSSSKAEQDKYRRDQEIEKGQEFLAQLMPKLNQYYLKTKEQIQSSIAKALGKVGLFFDIEIIEKEVVITKSVGRGRPSPTTECKEEIIVEYELKYCLDPLAISQAANKDGIFPLVTNTTLAAVEVLKNYKNQPFLEKRFNSLKSVLEVAPVFLKKPERIEAMLLLYIIALMLIALIERKIRKNMAEQKISALPILPQNMKTQKPTWSNIKFCFNSTIMLSILFGNTDNWLHQVKGIDKTQQQVLKLLGIENSKYDEMTPNWWLSITDRAG